MSLLFRAMLVALRSPTNHSSWHTKFFGPRKHSDGEGRVSDLTHMMSCCALICLAPFCSSPPSPFLPPSFPPSLPPFCISHAKLSFTFISLVLGKVVQCAPANFRAEAPGKLEGNCNQCVVPQGGVTVPGEGAEVLSLGSAERKRPRRGCETGERTGLTWHQWPWRWEDNHQSYTAGHPVFWLPCCSR